MSRPRAGSCEAQGPLKRKDRGQREGRLSRGVTAPYHGVMPTLLQSMNEERAAAAERLRLEVRQALRAALTDLLPGRSVTVFGSLTQTGRFTEYSDVDLALRELPAGLSLYQLIALLSERLGRRVDVVMLCETRLRDKIEREGEVWIP